MSFVPESPFVQGSIVTDSIVQSNTAAGGNQISLAPATALTVYQGVVGAAGYAISLDAYQPGVVDAPLLKVSMIWKNTKGGIQLGGQHWFILCTNVLPAVNNTLVLGRGPTDGNFVEITITNYSAANTVALDFSLLQSGRVISRHDWRSFSNNINLSYTAFGLTMFTPVSDPPNLILGNSPSIPVNAGATATRVHALYAGSAQFSFEAVNATAGLAGTVFVYALDPDFATPAQLIDQIALAATMGSTQSFLGQIDLPRGPVAISFLNNAATQMTVTYALIALEVAS